MVQLAKTCLIATLFCCLSFAGPPPFGDPDPSKWPEVGGTASVGASDDGDLTVEGEVQVAVGEGNKYTLVVSAGRDETEVSVDGTSPSALLARRLGLPSLDALGGAAGQGLLRRDIDVEVFHMSVGLRRYISREGAPWAFYIGAAPGVYILDPGDAELGWRIKGGFEIKPHLRSRWGFDFSGSFKQVSTPGSDIRYGTFQVGLRYHFVPFHE